MVVSSMDASYFVYCIYTYSHALYRMIGCYSTLKRVSFNALNNMVWFLAFYSKLVSLAGTSNGD